MYRKLALPALLAGCILITPVNAVESLPFASERALPATQWRPLDIVFSCPPPAKANPFDVSFQATLTGPDGTQLVIPGFYDGDDRYLVRVTLPAAGEWSLKTASSLAPLEGRSGRISVTAAREGRHGPIVVRVDKPRQFAHADGSGYFPIAFEADWLFALDAENPDDIPKTRTLLTQLAANGFNQIILNVFAYDVVWHRDPKLDPQFDYGRPRVFPFGGNNTAPQHGTLAVKFFQRYDRVIAELDRLGLVAHVMIYVWNKQVAWPPADSDDDNRYFDYVVKRYQAFPNLIWDISKEATGYGHNDNDYITRRIKRLHALAAHQRLVTVHDHGYCDAFPEMVDFISVQNWKPEIWNVMMNVGTKHPKLPALNIENGGYERGPFRVFDGAYLNPETLLDRAYLCAFAGAFPSYYWQDAAWSVVIHDPGSLPEADRPRLNYYRHMATLVQRAGLSELEPAPKFSNVGFCLSNNRDRFVYYLLPHTSSIYLQLGEARNKPLKSTWFNPLSGEFRDAGQPANAPSQCFYPPNETQSWVLSVELKDS
ncbi:MAG: DUF4038 domain-containing protein [Lacunisphaera sp.]|nr:DUF4038 domain-containing protein [Lacunisphaera sp.]